MNMTKLPHNIVAIILFLLITSTSCTTLSDKSKETSSMKEDVIRLLEVTESIALSKQMLLPMLDTLSQTNPEIPQEIWKRLYDSFDADLIISEIVPLYLKYFTHEDIKNMLDFYTSPTGEKTIEIMPALIQESMVIGQALGRRVMQEIIEDLKKEGYELNSI